MRKIARLFGFIGLVCVSVSSVACGSISSGAKPSTTATAAIASSTSLPTPVADPFRFVLVGISSTPSSDAGYDDITVRLGMLNSSGQPQPMSNIGDGTITIAQGTTYPMKLQFVKSYPGGLYYAVGAGYFNQGSTNIYSSFLVPPGFTWCGIGGGTVFNDQTSSADTLQLEADGEIPQSTKPTQLMFDGFPVLDLTAAPNPTGCTPTITTSNHLPYDVMIGTSGTSNDGILHLSSANAQTMQDGTPELELKGTLTNKYALGPFELDDLVVFAISTSGAVRAYDSDCTVRPTQLGPSQQQSIYYCFLISTKDKFGFVLQSASDNVDVLVE